MIGTRKHIRIFLFSLTPAVLFLSACGGSDPGNTDQTVAQPAANDPEKEVATAFGGGAGGGTLIFDGSSYAIDYVFCSLDPPVQIATVGEGYKVSIEGSEKRPSVSISTPGSYNWVSDNNEFTVAGSLVTSSVSRYRSNHDDGVREASFEIQCP